MRKQNKRAVRLLARGDDCRDNDDQDQDDDTCDQAHAHLHVLPPHLLAHTVGTATEALGGDGQVVGLVLQRIEALTTLRDLVDVVTHHTDGVVDLLRKELAMVHKGVNKEHK